MNTTTQVSGAIDVAAIRASFPALARRTPQGGTVAYFDGPGGTQVPQDVVDAMSDYLLHHNANSHWAFATSVETDAIIAAARRAMADFLNAEPDEVAFGANMTTLTFHIARALGRGWGPGDEVIVTELDHHANVAPWTEVAKERGVTVRTVRMDLDTYQLDFADLQRLLSPRTKLLAIGAASNAVGTITDVRAAADLARSVGALTYVDAVHYAPHVLVDVKQLGCDFLACSAYKFYGPHIGIAWGRRELIEHLDVPRLIPASNTAPERLETGTQNHEGMAGTLAAVDYLASLAAGATGRTDRRDRLAAVFDALHERGATQVRRLWDGLSAIDGVRVFGPAPDAPRTGTVSFTIDGVTPATAARSLSNNGVFVSHGDFYAHTVVDRLGLQPEGLLRAGCACYTDASDVDRLIEGVEAIAARR
jgi:cysteine desulfurase family protein (TIGR01976 family)